jgi:hypothetical protein
MASLLACGVLNEEMEGSIGLDQAPAVVLRVGLPVRSLHPGGDHRPAGLARRGRVVSADSSCSATTVRNGVTSGSRWACSKVIMLYAYDRIVGLLLNDISVDG